MLNNPITKPKHHWIFEGHPLIKAVADKAKAEGYRVFLNIKDETCFPEGTYGFITPKDGSKLLYFQMQDFNTYVEFSVEIVPSREYGSSYGINKDDICCLEDVNKHLNLKSIFDNMRPVGNQALYTLNMKEHDPWGLRGLAEY